MENLIVTGAVVAFLLLILPAVVVPFLNQNPSSVDTTPRTAPDPIGPITPKPDIAQRPADRIAA